MRKSSKVICFLTVFLLILFPVLAYAAYPRIMWWMLKVTEKEFVVSTADGVFMHQFLFLLSIAVSAIAIGVGTYMISKKRHLKETVIGWFVQIDVALVSMIGWLAVLKYRFMNLLSGLTAIEDQATNDITFQLDVFDSLPLYEVGIAASVAVLLVAWIYPKKFED